MGRDVAEGARLLWRLPAFMRKTIDPAEARSVLRCRFERRGPDFLALMRRAVYDAAGNPYRWLLDLAGCEHGDLTRLVDHEGVEGALRTLLRHGVYLTVDEFKGRCPIVRGNATISPSPDAWRSPFSAFDVLLQSGGSRNVPTPVPFDLRFIRDTGVDKALMLRARGGMQWLHANWGVPGGALLAQLLRFTVAGAVPAGWFWQVDAGTPGFHPRYRWSALAIRAGSLMAGIRLPRPVHAPLGEPLSVTRWMADALRAGKVPHLHTFASSAARLCQAALDAGVDLRGAQFTLTSEPITAARMDAVRRCGATGMPRYGTVECGPIGYGCLAPEAPDEVHLLHDLHALVQQGENGGPRGLPHKALFVSSLRPTAPLILLNVSLGDQAVVTRRSCGCPLEGLGWATHLHTIRSFEKLTAGGMTFSDTNVVRVLEEVLPARFGGGPTSYQIVEEETGTGHPLLRLLVHPEVGPINSETVADAFLRAISPGSGAERVMAQLWRDNGVLHVESRPPLVTESGKVLHLHLRRPGGGPMRG
jgi:hypothetical protein